MQYFIIWQLNKLRSICFLFSRLSIFKSVDLLHYHFIDQNHSPSPKIVQPFLSFKFPFSHFQLFFSFIHHQKNSSVFILIFFSTVFNTVFNDTKIPNTILATLWWRNDMALPNVYLSSSHHAIISRALATYG